MIRLEPMAEALIHEFVQSTIESFAQDQVRAGNWARSEVAQKGEELLLSHRRTLRSALLGAADHNRQKDGSQIRHVRMQIEDGSQRFRVCVDHGNTV